MVDASHAKRPPHAIIANAPIYGGSCLALAADLRHVTWPHKFRLELAQRYNGSGNPVEFLQLYTIGIQVLGGDDRVMANWFPMALKEPARSWIMNLPEASVTSWGDLCEKFVTNFRGTYERPLTKDGLQNIR